MELGTGDEISEEEIAEQLEKEGEIDITVSGDDRIPIGSFIEMFDDHLDNPNFDIFIEHAELVFVTNGDDD